MLSSLRITNFAIVKELELDFKAGTTAFTGETGAGKSIMIDALTLALGGRGDASVVRNGEEKCDISACFIIATPSEAAQWLEHHDIDYEEEIYLRRVIQAEGRSKTYINGQLLPLQKVREFAQFLVHIHGQHQHQTLLQHQTHRLQLDQFCHHPQLLENMQDCFKAMEVTKHAINNLLQIHNNSDRLSELEYQIKELQALNVGAEEASELNNEHQLLHHAKDYIEHAQSAHTLLNGDEAITLCQGLHQALQHLQNLPQNHPRIHCAMELLNNALIQCEEASDELSHFAEAVSLDPERLFEVEQRLAVLHQAARKYHVEVSALHSHQQRLQVTLDSLRQKDQNLAQLQSQLAEQQLNCEKAALLLRQSRIAHAPKLSQAISAIIQQLGMPKGEIFIDITPLDTLHRHGQDRVEYKVCTNPGMPADSLAKIASGGELSRISLAIQMITAQQGATPTLLFDEVDVGIGGATAALVGKLLRQLGERLQIFCVTHQPQVAASAHQQVRVEKHSENGQTFSHIFSLDSLQRGEEIARMIGGLTITEQTRNAAREMLLQGEI